jgi:CRP/FNR family transcriptional regulator, anaerobic regulatory protein
LHATVATNAKALSRTPAPAIGPAFRVDRAAPHAPVVALRDPRSRCQTCHVRSLCLSGRLALDEIERFERLISHRTRVRRHDTLYLYRAGDPFCALYAIRSGSLKTAVLAEDGREQVTGYHLPGDVIGFDGIGTEHHGAGAVALEDADVCVLPFAGIENLARTLPALQHSLHRTMSAEITRYQSVMLQLGSMQAHERLALFLLSVAERYRRRGQSSTEFTLRLTREEIGSYLGLKLETVSRLFSRFQGEGLVQVQGRAVKLLDPVRLRWIVGQRG